ncbi:DUF4334 domain-containing protein [Allorhizobium undicola]|uniref:DUF4334 domain-containing protein n=1 Tax=Allorhizobium undicola TaxID=78527 RepID=UPI000688F766|nr:DUF4334 domain-containing protein [Allorhizobium undicola]
MNETSREETSLPPTDDLLCPSAPSAFIPEVAGWLSNWQAKGLSPEEAIARFLDLPAMEVEEMAGRWRASELPTFHPLDGLLVRFGWHGKWFVSAEEGHPLMVKGRFGLFPLNPFVIPLRLMVAHRWLFDHFVGYWLVRHAGRLFAAPRAKARLRPVALGGTVSAAMIYDEKPIIDHFRRLDSQRCVGLMDYRDFDRPFFFLLIRDESTPQDMDWNL